MMLFLHSRVTVSPKAAGAKCVLIVGTSIPVLPSHRRLAN